VLSGLLTSARELRNPLTVGYSLLISFWLVAGEAVDAAARRDPLGRRLLAGLDSIGDGARLALVTFAAAIVGSVLWNFGIARLVRFLSAISRHPDWPKFIDEARNAVRNYEQYKVVTEKGHRGNSPSPFDASHTVPSPRWATYLHERVDERERKAAEMSFRVTLAVALVPVAIALGVEGQGLWWLSIFAIPFVWLDVAMMKYTTLRTVRRYEIEDLQPELELLKARLADAERPSPQTVDAQHPGSQAEEQRVKRVERLRAEVEELEVRLKKLSDDETRRVSRLFAFLEGRATDS